MHKRAFERISKKSCKNLLKRMHRFRRNLPPPYFDRESFTKLKVSKGYLVPELFVEIYKNESELFGRTTLSQHGPIVILEFSLSREQQNKIIFDIEV